jgi:hypothetical protein
MNTLMRRNYLLKGMTRRCFSAKSHIDQVFEKDGQYVEKAMGGGTLSTSEFVNFTRVITQRKLLNKEIWTTFEKQLPSHINNLNEFDIRKVCSALEFNRNFDSSLIDQLKARAKGIRKQEGVNEEEYQQNKPSQDNIWKSLPVQFKVWMRYAVVRDWIVSKFSFGILK